MISKIDIAILVFMTYHIIRGYSAGFSKSLFLSIRFIVSIILTRFIYINFSDEIITSVFYERYQLIMHELITKIIFRSIITPVFIFLYFNIILRQI